MRQETAWTTRQKKRVIYATGNGVVHETGNSLHKKQPCPLWGVSTGGCGTVHVSTAKSGQGPDWSVISRTVRRLKGCQHVRATHDVRWLVDRNVTSVRQADNKKQTNTLPPRYFWTTAKASFIEQNVAQRLAVLLGRPTLLCSLFNMFFFFLGPISRLHCVGLLWGHDAYVAAAAIPILLKGPMTCQQVWCLISLYKPFWKSAPYDIKRGRKWACPPRCVLDRSVYQPSQWTVANVAHLSVTRLGGHAHLWCHKGILLELF